MVISAASASSVKKGENTMMKKCFSVAMSGVLLLGLAACMGVIDARAQENAAGPKTTLDNLLTAYNSESNSHVRYLTFAEKAAVEGYDIVAGLFRAIAFAEQVRYERYAGIIKKLGGEPKSDIETPVVNSTKENLETGLKIEGYEAKTMYAEFLQQAKKENIKDAIDAFKDAQAAEDVYGRLFEQMLNNLTFSKGLIKDFYVCPVCGNVVDAVTQSRCQICTNDTRKFKKIK